MVKLGQRGILMSQKHSKSQDEISQLLDSFEVEDTLEEKMENFTQEKERQSRIERAKKNSEDFNRRNTEEMDLTQIIDPIDDSEFEDEEYEEDGSQTKTMMWDKDQIDQEATDTNKTVVINDDEIQSLLEEDKGPKLKREVHRGSSKKQGQDKKKIAIIIAGVAAVILAGVAIFGVINLIGSLGSDDQISEEEQKQNYEEILAWANGYDSLSDDEKANIIDFETMFNRLSDEQQSKIDKVLKSKTGKTFDELLAQAKSDAKDKADASNNNTEVAQQKAKLRERISSLEDDLANAKQVLDDANSKLNAAKSNLSSIQSKVSSADSTLQSANSRKAAADQALADLEAERQAIEEKDNSELTDEDYQRLQELYNQRPGLLQEQSAAQSEVESAQATYDDLVTQQTQASSEVDSAQSAVNEAQSNYDSINSELQSLRKQLDSLDD